MLLCALPPPAAPESNAVELAVEPEACPDVKAAQSETPPDLVNV